MGLSLATRATIFITEAKAKTPTGEQTDSTTKATDERTNNPPNNKTGAPKEDTPVTPRLSDLIRSSVDEGNPVAITKAQMLFWTCIAGFLFCEKSLLNGALWEMPWQLVALMGISQVSYVIPPAYQTAKGK